MAIRLLKVLLFFPMCFISVFIQLPIQGLRFIITGKSVSEPWLFNWIFNS